MNRTLKKMIKEVSKYKLLFYSGVFVAITGAILDSLPPRVYTWAIDNIIIPGNYDHIFAFAITFAVLIALIVLDTYLFIFLMGKLEVKFSQNLRNNLFKKIQRLSMNYYNENQDGWIIARLTSDVSKLAEVMSWQFVDSFYFTLLIIVSIISIFFYSVPIGIAVLVTYPILFAAIHFIKSKILVQYRKVRKQNSIITSKYNELIGGIQTIKTMNIEEQNFEDFRHENSRMKRSAIRTIILSTLFPPTVLLLGFFMVSIGIGMSVDQFQIGNLTTGEVSAILSYILILVDVTTEYSAILSELQHAQANAERIFSLEETIPDLVDSNQVITKYGDVLENVKNFKKLDGNINFKNIHFKYQNGQKIFSNYNLKINKGTSVALVGATGSGKTTLVNLLSRFYEPTNGRIEIDNIDIQDFSLNFLHSNIGHVLQTPFLFKGTVKENIIYNYNATDQEVTDVANILGLDYMLSHLTNGLDTQVGEGGGNLSVGEKQLISFARALIKNPNIIILDEATSSIDSESEELVQNAIDKLMLNRTTFIVAHRLSTIEKCDLIVCMKNGKIVEQGTHQELLKNKNYYYDLRNQ